MVDFSCANYLKQCTADGNCVIVPAVRCLRPGIRFGRFNIFVYRVYVEEIPLV